MQNLIVSVNTLDHQFSADFLRASIVRQTAHTYFLLVIEKWVQMKYNFFG